MLVKKKNGNWQPAENKGLKVGETIDITDPRSLILSGYAAAVDEKGIEISSYDLYGVITKDERKEFEEYKELKKQEAIKSKYEAEAEILRKELAAEKAKASIAPQKLEALIEAKEEDKVEIKKK